MFHVLYDHSRDHIMLMTFANSYPSCHGAQGCESYASHISVAVRILALGDGACRSLSLIEMMLMVGDYVPNRRGTFWYFNVPVC